MYNVTQTIYQQRRDDCTIFVNLIDMLKNVNFFKTRKPRQFEYKPLYYDEKKEERKRRLAEIRGEGDFSQDALRSRINFRDSRKKHSTPNVLNRNYYLRLLIILIGLLAVALWLLK
jgi:hypothetical protein